jgi:hypothetical protein
MSCYFLLFVMIFHLPTKGMTERFWLEDPSALFNSIEVRPLESATLNQNLNSMTRLIVVIAIVLAFLEQEYWLTVLIVGVLVIIFIYLLKLDNPQALIENFDEDPTDFDYYKDKKLVQSVTDLYTQIIAPLVEDETTPDKSKKQEEKTAEQHMRDWYEDLEDDERIEKDREGMFWSLF